MFPLALEVEGLNVVATKSRRVYVVRGVLALIALPVLFALLFALIFGGLDDDIVTLIWAGLSGASALFGLVLLVFARKLSRRGAVTFDRARGVVSVGTSE